jgi:hypothetical protein
MDDQGPRYAIYFVPALDSDLYRFGSAVLQFDAYAARSVLPPEELRGEAWRELTDEPRRYGFHATLKAPFYLSPSSSEPQLVSAMQSFAAIGRRVATITPVVRILSGFIAVVAEQPNPSLDGLAADCTTIFDAFRAPMSAPERARRLAAGLNPSQIENLDRWGYAYSFGEFRFHLTLTGGIEVARRDAALRTLQVLFERMRGGGPVAVDRIALVKQDSAEANFRVLAQATLRGEG